MRACSADSVLPLRNAWFAGSGSLGTSSWKGNEKEKETLFLHRLECWNKPGTHFLECPDDHVYFHHGWAAHGRRPPPLELARSPQGGEVSPQEAKFREEGRGEEGKGRKEWKRNDPEFGPRF